MKITDDIRMVMTLGFFAILVLMSLIIYIALSQLEAFNSSISNVVSDTNVKMETANTMRDSIRLRANRLKSMALSNDAFIRDDEYQLFLHDAQTYRLAREKLMSLTLNETEHKILDQLSETTRQAQPVNEQAADLLLTDAPENEIATAMEAAIKQQNTVLLLLSELVEFEQRSANEVLVRANDEFNESRRIMFILAGLALLFGLAIALHVTRSAATKNRKIYYQANHDDLTGLLNRRAFEDEFKLLLATRSGVEPEGALLYMDLDQFKIVNDTCGHAAGDELLRQITVVFSKRMRTTDVLARLGGDEFGVLLKNCSMENATRVAESLRESAERFQFSWKSREFSIGVSIGVVPLTHERSSIAKVLSTADMACLEAKQAGRNRIRVADIDDKKILERRTEMDSVRNIKQALEEDRFSLYYQTVVPVNDHIGHPGHIEILVRMVDEGGVLIQPGGFIPVAERFDLMLGIDKWVIRNALVWLKSMSDATAVPKLMINLSGQSICDDSFLDYILKSLDSSSVQPEAVCFEITETAAIANLDKAVVFINALKDRGCEFALDDFGSGLSSFAYLKKLPVDYLKIDGSFVTGITSDPIDYAMVQSINEIGHVMNKLTIAEFVENNAILESLKEIGVDYAQGYGISRPRPIAEFGAAASVVAEVLLRDGS